jgi:ankyrin repeat protein
MILKDLDDQSLMKSIEANRELGNFLSNDRIFWTRVLAKYRSSFIQFKDSWKRSLCQVPVVKIKELAIAAQSFFKKQSRLESQWSPLHIVANKGSLELFKYISRKCGSINPVRDDGITAIHMAAVAGHLEIVTFIIDNHQNQNQSSANGLTPLHCAASMGHFETCRFIINLLVNKNPRDNQGITPLHCAAGGGHTKICKLIMEDLVDKNPANNNGRTPLHSASAFDQLEPIKLIIPHVQNKNPEDIYGFTPLQLAIELGYLEIAKLFLEHPDVKILGDDSYTLLHSAARYGDLALCKLLMEFLLIDNSKVKNYADRNGWTPLHYAAINGHVAIYELFSEYFEDDHRSNNAWTLGPFAAENGIPILGRRN